MNEDNKKQIQLIYSKNELQNPLRQLINMTRGMNNEKIRFSYLQRDFSIFKGVSIREFLTIEAGPKTFGIIDDDLLLKAIENTSIPSLKELFSQIKELENKKLNLSKNDLKLCGLVKTIMQNKNYIFLDHPEEYLTPNQIKLLKKILKEISVYKSNTIKIYSQNIDLWRSFVDLIYEAGPDGQFFPISENLDKLQESA